MFTLAGIFLFSIVVIGVAIAIKQITVLNGLLLACLAGFLMIGIRAELETSLQMSKVAYQLQRIADKQTGVNSIAQDKADLERAKDAIKAIIESK